MHQVSAALAAFLASFVEFVEALTIVLAVGAVRGWRPALAGTLAGCVLLLILVAGLGPVLGLIPISAVRLFVGGLLLLFGMRWLRKAILRAAGYIALHDEAVAFAANSTKLRESASAARTNFDWPGTATAFQAVVLEGIEVVFIVIGVGATSGLLVPASIGAGLAGLIVVGLGLLLHRPLARIPENALKFVVGVMIAAFGIFWLGEGMGFPWPAEDFSLPLLALILLAVSLAAVPLLRQRRVRKASAA
jgi:Ca2+/H+ antiporter, TMEM165/GDT1 family